MKIALAHKRLDLKGGTERDLFKTAEGLRDLGHDVHLFCSEYGVAPPRGVTAHRVPVLPLGRTARLWSFALWAPKLIRQAGCDVVIGFGRMVEADVLRSGGGTHRGFLERLANDGGVCRRIWQTVSIYHQSLLALERRQFAAQRVKTIIAVSDEVKRDILNHYAVPSDKIVVLYNGVDAQRFHPRRRGDFRKSIRERWKIPAEAPLVLFVGSGFRRKGLDRLLSVWQSSQFAEVYLLVVGTDGRFASYQARAQTVAPGRIVFAGRQDVIENFYAAADVVALPALQEAFGNVVLEALASGLPVLVSHTVGAASVLRGALMDGVIDRPDNSEEMSNKLLALLQKANDEKLRQEARSIGEDYSWECHFRRLDALLREICAKSAIASLS